MEEAPMHIAMYPWLAFGHISPYVQLSNKLAKRGHKISIFIPTRTQSKLQHLNLHPNLITFFPITIPHIEGLPHGAETTSDVDPSQHPLLMTSMDHTQDQVEHLLIQLKPNIIFFDFTHWLPDLARRLGIKSVQYMVTGLTPKAFIVYSETKGQESSVGFPDLPIRLHLHEEKMFEGMKEFEFGSGLRFLDRLAWGARSSDVFAMKTCKEIEGPFVDYLENVEGRPILLSGPVMPEPQTSTLEPKWDQWLAGFEHGSVIYCAFGSECKLELGQLHALMLGLEQTGIDL